MAEDSSRLSEEELYALASDEGFEEDSASLIDPKARSARLSVRTIW